LLSASDDKTLKIWALGSKAGFLSAMAGHTNWVRTARFSPDNRIVASAGDDKTAKIWDVASQKTIFTYTEHL